MRISSLLFLLVGCTVGSPMASTTNGRETATYIAPLEGLEHSTKFPNEYLVIFKPEYTLAQHFETIGRNLSDAPMFREFSFGYRAKLNDWTRDDKVRRDPGVRMVETNRPVFLVNPVNSTDSDPVDHASSRTKHRKREYVEVRGYVAPYGLQMITTGSSKLSTPVADGGVYDYVDDAGLGVQVYIMDTGIRTTHALFEGRARNFGDLASTDKSPYVNETMADVIGHGTHVAGTVGAWQYGAAPHASLINVKVLGNGSDLANIAQAIRDIRKEHKANAAKSGNGFWTFRGSVINMSMEWEGRGFAVQSAIIDAYRAGISIFAAAGNNNINAKNTYPCAYPQVRCIAAVDSDYNKASFSNYGSVVDYIAPGNESRDADICTNNTVSLGIASDYALALKDGTSMACPHAAGTAAIFSSWRGLVTNYDPASNFVYWNSITGVVSGFSGTTGNFITTGIHSPKKYPKEPFRWAGNYPVKNHVTSDGLKELVVNAAYPNTTINPYSQTPSSSLPLSDLATSFWPIMATSSLAAASGLTTQSGDPLWDPVISVSGSANATVSFSSVPSSVPAVPSSAAPVPSSAAPAPSSAPASLSGSSFFVASSSAFLF